MSAPQSGDILSKSQLRTLARYLSAATALISLAALFGWIFDSSLLKSGIPGLPPTLLSTALALMFCAISLFFFALERRSRLREAVGRINAIAALVIGFLSFSEGDHWQVEESLGSLFGCRATESLAPPVRGSVSPMLFGVALLLLDSRNRTKKCVFGAAAVLPIFISFLAITGHAFNVPSFYSWDKVSPKVAVSFPAAVAFVLFGIGLLSARPERELVQMFVSKTTGGYIARRLLFAPVLVPFLMALIQRVMLRLGFQNPAIVQWLFPFSNIGVFTIVIGWISLLLYRMDIIRRNAEESIQVLNEELEERVKNRTMELTRANLLLELEIEERKKTEQQLLRTQRVECLGALAGGIAHDLNNMLAPIIMVSSQIEEELTSEESKRNIGIITQSAQRGADLIKQIMTFARGSIGSMKAMNLRFLLRDFEKTLRATFPQSINLKVRVDRDLPLILGDPTQVYQVLMNLCINARDAMPVGGLLSIEAQSLPVVKTGSEPMQAVRILVTDTGVGISQEHLPQIFSPFFTTKAPEKGTGLGLATVKKIVEGHRGTVEIRSEPGKGTTFGVTFIQAPAEPVSEQARPIEEIQGNAEHILVVDDEMVLREIIKTTLEHARYRVTLASNGVEALEFGSRTDSRFDLVLTDFEMPFLDGGALVERLSTSMPELRFVIMTGSLGNKEYEQIKVERKWRLGKPFTTQVLLQTLNKALH